MVNTYTKQCVAAEDLELDRSLRNYKTTSFHTLTVVYLHVSAAWS